MPCLCLQQKKNLHESKVTITIVRDSDSSFWVGRKFLKTDLSAFRKLNLSHRFNFLWFCILLKIRYYRTHAIISRDFYIFYPIFHCALYCRAVSVAGNLYTKQGNSSIFGPKICGFKSRAGYNGMCTVVLLEPRCCLVNFSIGDFSFKILSQFWCGGVNVILV